MQVANILQKVAHTWRATFVYILFNFQNVISGIRETFCVEIYNVVMQYFVNFDFVNYTFIHLYTPFLFIHFYIVPSEQVIVQSVATP